MVLLLTLKNLCDLRGIIIIIDFNSNTRIRINQIIQIIPIIIIIQELKWQKQPPLVFYKKGVLKNIVIFTGKHVCWSLFLIKLQANTGVSLWRLWKFSEHLFWRTSTNSCLWNERNRNFQKFPTFSKIK